VTSVSQNDIAVSNGMYFVDLVLYAELVEASEKFGEKLHYFLGIFDIVTELSESNHVSEQQSDIF